MHRSDQALSIMIVVLVVVIAINCCFRIHRSSFVLTPVPASTSPVPSKSSVPVAYPQGQYAPYPELPPSYEQAVCAKPPADNPDASYYQIHVGPEQAACCGPLFI